MDAGPLTFAVFHDAVGPLRWQWDCVSDLVTTGEAVLIGTIANPDPVARTKQGLWQRIYDRAISAGLDAFDTIQPPDGHNPCLGIGNHELLEQADFILDFSASGVALPPLVPPVPLWRIRMGNAAADERPAGRETASRARLITVSVVSTAGDTESVVHYATIKTRRTQRATMAAVLDAARATCLGAVRRLRSRHPVQAQTAIVAATLPAPTPLAIVAGQLSRSVRRATDICLFHDIWALGVIRQPVGEVLNASTMPTPSWRPVPPDGEFHADPFPVRADGRTAMLFERYLPDPKRGLIAAAWLDEWEAPPSGGERTAIDMGCHMSYPAIFMYGGGTYCAPETHSLGGLPIFKMGSDPWHWTQVAHVLPGLPLIDATLTQHGGMWWLLATLDGVASDTDLHAWYAESPFGPWTPHRLNPVKSDVRSSRPAGNLFRFGDALYRPAQDCVKGYGTAVVINRIEQIDRDAFVETTIKCLVPDGGWPFPDGLHTFNVFDDHIVIDAKRRTSRASAVLRRLRIG